MTRLPTTAEPSRPLRPDLLAHRDRLFGNIQDLVDHHSHAAVAVVENDHLHRIGHLVRIRLAGFEHGPQRNQRQDAVPVLHHLASARMLDATTAGTPPAWRRAKAEPPGARRNRRGTAAAAAARFPIALSVPPPRAPARGIRPSTPERWPMPSTSRIRATRPSPMIVAPAYTVSPFNCLPKGLTTISWVSLMPSTTSPNCRSSACRTTMLTASARSGRFQPQHLIQIGDGQKTPAPAVHRRSMHMLDVLFRGISLQADQFEQADLGNDEPLPAAGRSPGRE